MEHFPQKGRGEQLNFVCESVFLHTEIFTDSATRYSSR